MLSVCMISAAAHHLELVNINLCIDCICGLGLKDTKKRKSTATSREEHQTSTVNLILFQNYLDTSQVGSLK